jgi:predicted nucleotidyltransferase
VAEFILDPNWVEYEAVIGSRAYGLAREDSDVDIRGWFLPPIRYALGLTKAPEQVSSQGESGGLKEERVFYEIEKFVRLALQGNPNLLEILWSPQVRMAGPLGKELLAIRGGFLSQRLRYTHAGYAAEQFKKMENHPEMPWKHAAHLLRVLLSGISAFETGEIQVEIKDPQWRDLLRQVRAGEVSREQFDKYHQELRRWFDHLADTRPLPPEPDTARANHFLIDARWYAWETNR